MKDLNYETWAAMQDFTPEDFADAINDSKAMVEAALCGDWEAVAGIVRSRVELKAKRWAQRSLDLPLTPWVDDEEELLLYRQYCIEKLQTYLDQKKGSVSKINPYNSEASNEN